RLKAVGRPALHVTEQVLDREPLESLDQLAHRLEAPALALLPQHDQRRRGEGNVRLDVGKETNPHVRIANLAERTADALEARGQVIRQTAMPLVGQRKDRANAACRHPRVVNALDVAVEHRRQPIEQDVGLALQNGERSHEMDHSASGENCRALGVQSASRPRTRYTCKRFVSATPWVLFQRWYPDVT